MCRQPNEANVDGNSIPSSVNHAKNKNRTRSEIHQKLQQKYCY